MEDDKLFPALRAGANGYQMKTTEPDKIAEGIRAVSRGEPLLHPDVARRLMAEAGAAHAERPEGTVTILFTDIEGSTMIVAELGDEAARAIFREHDQILRDVMRRHGGTEVKHQGDGFMIAFASARSSVLCAIDIQQEIARHNKKRPRAAVKVRMGINTGEAISENKDYFGEAVILSSRISSKAHGGQIYVSELTKALIGSMAGVRFIDKGSHRLKGLKGTHKVFEVPWGKAGAT
jgi:class 3 adenylate cyclase